MIKLLHCIVTSQISVKYERDLGAENGFGNMINRRWILALRVKGFSGQFASAIHSLSLARARALVYLYQIYAVTFYLRTTLMRDL